MPKRSQTVRKIVFIKQAVSADLALRNRADSLFDDIKNLHASEIIIDFSEVKSISRSFAHQYQVRKQSSRKKISEVHVPEHVAKMFRVVKNARGKDQLVSDDPVPMMTI